MSDVENKVEVEIPEVDVPEVDLPVEVSLDANVKTASPFSKEAIMNCMSGTAVTVLCTAIIQTGVNGLIQGGKKLYYFSKKKLNERKEAKELKKLEEALETETKVAQEEISE